ncbi:MAG TPA: hypothetical protein VHP36_07830 [Chitinispirillaceae bacterium]|nr:hypothetical protein [Chitinispirillaceae bacterium]
MKWFHLYAIAALLAFSCNKNSLQDENDLPEITDDKTYIDDTDPLDSDILDDEIVKEIKDTPADTTDLRPWFQMKVFYNKSKTWSAQAELKKDGRIVSPGISGAKIYIDSVLLIEKTSYDGIYTGTVDSLRSGQSVTIRLFITDTDTHSFTAIFPEFFTSSPSLTASKVNDSIKFVWESADCNEYLYYKKLENDFGTKVEIMVDDGSIHKDTIYITTVTDLLDGCVSISPEPQYFTFWVCPSNKTGNLAGFSADSYLRLSGKPSNGITNKSKK